MSSRIKKIQNQFVNDPVDYLNLWQMLPEKEILVISQVRKFGQKYLTTEKLESYIDKAQFPQYLLEPLRKLDIAQYFVDPPEGQKFSLIGQGFIVATLAEFDLSVSTFIFLQIPLCARTLQQLGSDNQKQKYLGNMLNLTGICGWALTEREVGSNSTRIEAKIEKTQKGFLLTGNKRWIGNADRDYLIAYATHQQNSKKRIVGIIIDMRWKGISRKKIENKLALRSVQNCEIEFDKVLIPQSNILPKANNYRNGVEGILKHSRIIVIWNTIGGCIGVYKKIVNYVRNNLRFSIIVAEYHIVQDKVIKIMGALQALILVTWRITQLYEKDNSFSTAKIGMVKAFVTEKARNLCSVASDILGEDGLDYKQSIMKILCDIEALYTYEGTYDINTLVAGSQLTGVKAFV